MANESGRKLAVVTGASDGIGYELAKVFAENGFDLVVCAEDAGIVEARQAFEGLGGSVQSVQADLSTYEGVEKLWEAVRGLGRPLDAIAINAGIGSGGPFAETDLSKELRLVGLNCTGSVHLAKRAVQEMVSRGSGRILFTSSIASTMPGPFEAVYAASKAFVQSLALAVREELKDSGVTVTSLMPGPTDTNFFNRAGMQDTKVGADKKDDPAQVARQGFEALMAGKDQLVGGSIKNKVEAAVAKVLPESVKGKIHRGMSEPGSADKAK